MYRLIQTLYKNKKQAKTYQTKAITWCQLGKVSGWHTKQFFKEKDESEGMIIN